MTTKTGGGKGWNLTSPQACVYLIHRWTPIFQAARLYGDSGNKSIARIVEFCETLAGHARLTYPFMARGNFKADDLAFTIPP